MTEVISIPTFFTSEEFQTRNKTELKETLSKKDSLAASKMSSLKSMKMKSKHNQPFCILYHMFSVPPFPFSKWAELAETNPKKVRDNFKIKGKPTLGCNLQKSDSLSFVTRKSFVKLPNLSNKTGRKNSRKISFQFRTNEEDGLLLITSGAFSEKTFFGCELYDGLIYSFIQSEGKKREISKGEALSGTGQYNNGDWHKLNFEIDQDGAILTIDQRATPIKVPKDSIYNCLQLFTYACNCLKMQAAACRKN